MQQVLQAIPQIPYSYCCGQTNLLSFFAVFGEPSSIQNNGKMLCGTLPRSMSIQKMLCGILPRSMYGPQPQKEARTKPLYWHIGISTSGGFYEQVDREKGQKWGIFCLLVWDGSLEMRRYTNSTLLSTFRVYIYITVKTDW